MFRHLGIEPAEQRVLVLKSSVHFRADFGPLASEILIVLAPGPSPADPGQLPLSQTPIRCPDFKYAQLTSLSFGTAKSTRLAPRSGPWLYCAAR